MCFCIDMNYVTWLIPYFFMEKLKKRKKKNSYCTSLFRDVTKGSLQKQPTTKFITLKAQLQPRYELMLNIYTILQLIKAITIF
jgi:hypothetical protein